MSFPLYPRLGGLWKRLNARYDFIGYAPRGVGRSDPLSCQDPEEFLRGPNRSPAHPSWAFKQTMNERAAAYAAAGCAEAQPDRLRHYTTPNNARDLDVLRAALGQRGLSYLGVSYGTYIGSAYATLFPSHVRRLVLDSVVDPSPDSVWYQANLDQNRAFQRRWEDWKTWVARHEDAYRLGSTARQVQESFDAVRTAVDPEARGRDRRLQGTAGRLPGHRIRGRDLGAVRAGPLRLPRGRPGTAGEGGRTRHGGGPERGERQCRLQRGRVPGRALAAQLAALGRATTPRRRRWPRSTPGTTPG